MSATEYTVRLCAGTTVYEVVGTKARLVRITCACGKFLADVPGGTNVDELFLRHRLDTLEKAEDDIERRLKDLEDMFEELGQKP